MTYEVHLFHLSRWRWRVTITLYQDRKAVDAHSLTLWGTQRSVERGAWKVARRMARTYRAWHEAVIRTGVV